MMNARRVAPVVVCLALVVALAACKGKGAPARSEGTSTTHVAASAAPSPTPTPLPEVAVPADLSGSYKSKPGAAAASLAVMQGDGGKLFLTFSMEFGAGHSCDCSGEAKKTGEGSWEMTSGFEGTVWAKNSLITVEMPGEPECCGASFPGAPDFYLGTQEKPAACKVKAKKSIFKNADEKPTKAFVVKGNAVDAVQPASTEAMIARFKAKKTTTVGFLEAKDLTCPAK